MRPAMIAPASSVSVWALEEPVDCDWAAVSLGAVIDSPAKY
jgi:hypothetical protein